jgi:hypothetical protein
MALSTIPTRALTEQGINFRNLIINGDMSIAQRGGSSTGITSTGYNTVDRIQNVISSLGTWTESQSTDVPSGEGFAKSLKLDCTTADASPSAGDVMYLRTKIEGQNLQHLKFGTSNAESLTVSFWVKSNKTGTYGFRLYEPSNTRQFPKTYTINSADTWEKKTLTFTGDTTGSFTNDNSNQLQVEFYLGAGTNYTSGSVPSNWESQVTANRAVGQVNLADSTSNEWYITGVQLEVGTSASDFEFLPYDVNLRRCQRYFLRTYRGATGDYHTYPAKGQGTTAARFNFYLNVPMRATPSIIENANWRLFGSSGYMGNVSSTPSVLYYDVYGTALALEVGGYSGITDNVSYVISVQNSDYLDFDGEL